MRCTKAAHILGEFIYGEASERDRSRLQAHLDTCASCRDEFATVSSVASLVSQVPKLDPASEIGSHIHAAVASKACHSDACSSASAMLSDSADGLLSSVQEAFVLTHVRRCAGCAAELNAIKSLTGAIRAIPELDASHICIPIPQARRAFAPRWSWYGIGTKAAVAGFAVCAMIALTLSFRPAQSPTLTVVPARTAVVDRQPQHVTGASVPATVAAASQVRNEEHSSARRIEIPKIIASVNPRRVSRVPIEETGKFQPVAPNEVDSYTSPTEKADVAPVQPPIKPQVESAVSPTVATLPPTLAPVIKVSPPDDEAVKRAASIVVKSHSIDKWLEDSEHAQLPVKPDRTEVELLNIKF